jgi:2,3-bisphosphoglycerate-independent phosphoglycerate mutase
MPQNCCILIILDGWGINPESKGNAVSAAKTPFLDDMMATYPSSRLLCSGKSVGLPEGVMGNSEVGHLNIGAGRVVYQNLLRIDVSIEDGSFFSNPVFDQIISKVKSNDSSLHLMGLVSDGGVHSHLSHLLALLELGKQRGLEKVFVHAITDGRDTLPHSGVEYLMQVQKSIKSIGCGKIATVCGRYYAMDRDTRWGRVEKAYRLYTRGEGVKEIDPVKGLKRAYERGESDEFIKPIAITDKSGKSAGMVEDDDGIIFFNFRADRAREITRVFTEADFDSFKRNPFPKLSDYICTTRYDEKFDLPIAFLPVHRDQILGEIVSERGLRQLRIAETEKYAHVTYFFNGGEEKPFPQEDRCLIPSPRNVATYDLKPEMSAYAVTKEVLARIRSEEYALIVLNFANMDMVGHTGNMEAAIKACETVDRCVHDIVTEVNEKQGTTLLTADHGNAELMLDPHGRIQTAHTLNPVPLILIDDKRKNIRLKSGILGDIAPTILEIMGIEKPEQMTGKSLLKFP